MYQPIRNRENDADDSETSTPDPASSSVDVMAKNEVEKNKFGKFTYIIWELRILRWGE